MNRLKEKYQKDVEKESGGRIKVKLFLGSTLGDENETVLKCKRGQVEAVGASTGALASQVPEINVVELPYLFRDAKEADLIIDSVVTPDRSMTCARAASGTRPSIHVVVSRSPALPTSTQHAPVLTSFVTRSA